MTKQRQRDKSAGYTSDHLLQLGEPPVDPGAGRSLVTIESNMNQSKLTPGKLFNALFSMSIGQLVAEEFCAGRPLWLRVLAAAVSAGVTSLLVYFIQQRWQKQKYEA